MKCHPQMPVPSKPLHAFRRVLGTAQAPSGHVWSVGSDQVYLSGSPQISSQNTWEMGEADVASLRVESLRGT